MDQFWSLLIKCDPKLSVLCVVSVCIENNYIKNNITKIPNQKMTKKIRVRICSFFRALRCGLWHLYQRPWIRWVNQLQRFVFFRIFIFLKIYKKSNRSFKKVFNDVLQMKNQRWRICSFFRALRRGLWHLYQRPWKSGLI